MMMIIRRRIRRRTRIGRRRRGRRRSRKLYCLFLGLIFATRNAAFLAEG
jgi:hypothetical protein